MGGLAGTGTGLVDVLVFFPVALLFAVGVGVRALLDIGRWSSGCSFLAVRVCSGAFVRPDSFSLFGAGSFPCACPGGS